MITVRCFDSLEQAAHLRHDVDALNRGATRPDPFSTFEFFETYIRHDDHVPAGGGLRLWFLAAFRADRLIGYLALKQLTRRILGVRVVTLGFLVTHDTDRPHVVARPEDLRQVSTAFYAHLLARKNEWDYLEFQQQDDSSSLLPPPAAVDLTGYRMLQWPSLENCTVPVRWGSLREYVQAMSKKFRSNLGRQLDALFAEGDLELLSSSDPATTPALFDLYLGIEPRSWKAQANANIGRHPERVAYFRSLLDVQQPMRVSIQILLLDGIPVAGLICGAFLKGLYALHIVHDDRLRRLGAGSAMLLLGMRQAIEGSHAFFNLLSGFDYYKVRWLAQSTEVRTAQIYRVGSFMFWRRVVGDWKRRLFAIVPRRSPGLFNPVRRDVSGRDNAPAEHGKIARLRLDPAEHLHTETLIAQVRAGRGEFLSMAELAAAMPIRPQRSPASAARAMTAPAHQTG